MKRIHLGNGKYTPWFYDDNPEENEKLLERMTIDDLLKLVKMRKKGIKPLLVEHLKTRI